MINKKKQAFEKVKELMKEDSTISVINSFYKENDTLRDDSIKNVIVVSLLDDIYGKSFYVYMDAETLELLYVQGPHRCIEIDEFFSN
ncbi:hypothetical protein [Chryseobacterium mucoviscidosis]|uniref:Uncharacterized protein n=1 Tax=Chryseobacterium mucoviscidosis TaxID=1945581 RepID=A0A202BT78_9FLAO|nr:hypothetical protein [Chryseobacterium mucoviscidosis]OVE54719.1 hypothetical protein B0E34_18010 [Chryseobacterium mucoviscidosis]